VTASATEVDPHQTTTLANIATASAFENGQEATASEATVSRRGEFPRPLQVYLQSVNSPVGNSPPVAYNERAAEQSEVFLYRAEARTAQIERHTRRRDTRWVSNRQRAPLK
jgi:hypothetical protein